MTEQTEKHFTELALACGFKLKQQPDGSMALNPYVFDFARAVVAISAAPVVPAPVASAWLPIETAPKDGTEVILRRESRVGAAQWIKWPGSEFEYAGESWSIGSDGDSWDDDKEPTHWMPLPPAPGAQAAPVVNKPQILELDFKQATELLEMYGGEPAVIGLCIGHGHSGHGIYAHYVELPEEGAEFLGVADDEAAPVAQLSEPPEADMFWNDADPDRSADSIHEVLEREWSDGVLDIGETRTIQQAIRLPNVRVIVTAAEDNEYGFDWEYFEAAAPTTPKDAA